MTGHAGAAVTCGGHQFTCATCGVKGCCHECEDTIDAGHTHECWPCQGEPPDSHDELCPVGLALARAVEEKPS